jgi:hypothetical protein
MEQIITTALMLPYSYGLYYATVGLVFIRPRICAKFNLNSTIYWMIVYLLNMMLVRGLFKLNYLWLIFTSVILGGAIIQFANYNLIGKAPSLEPE